MLSFEVNNGRKICLAQMCKDGDVEVWTGDKNSYGCEYEISAGDFVMLLNYYRHIKENDIQNDFINLHGANKEV